MKTIILSIATLLSFGSFAQVKSLDGIELTQSEQNVYDFTINGDYQAFKLAKDLAVECDSYTTISDDILGTDALCGYFFHFNGYDVLYILVPGGVVKGSLIRKEER
jgi:hypothetical protein